MKLTKFGKPALWRSVAAVSGILLALSVGGTAVTTTWSGYINGFLGITNTQVVKDENSTEDPIHYKSEFSSYQEVLKNAQDVSKQIVGEGSALLKNEDNALPLTKGAKVTVLGYASADPALGGSGSGASNRAERKIDLEKAFDNDGKLTLNKTLYNWYKGQIEAENQAKNGSLTRTFGGGGFGAGSIPKNYIAPEIAADDIPDDVKSSFSEYNDAVILFFSRIGGEGADLIKQHATDNVTDESGKYLALTDKERTLLEEMNNNPAFANSKKIVILNTMNPPELGWLEEYNIDACLHIGGPGESGLDAVSDILVGNINPSARISDTYATDSFSAPAMMNFGDYTYSNGDAINRALNRFYVSYNEGIYVGYRYYETRYEDYVLGQGDADSAAGAWASEGNWRYDEEVSYPFGYGLSYSDFTQTLNSVNVDWANKTAEISVTVTNNSDVPGKDVVQVYAQAPYTAGGVEKSAVQLCAFAKTDIVEKDKPVTVNLTVDLADIASYDSEGYKTYIMDEGDYYFAIGDSAHDALNNILAKKDLTAEQRQRMDAEGDASKAWVENKGYFDEDEYSLSVTNKYITNRFDSVDLNYYTEGTGDEVTYLSRSDWDGTWPKSQDNLTATAEMISDINSYYDKDNKSPAAYEKGSSDTSSFISGADTGYSLVMMKGQPFGSDAWEDLLNQLTVDDLLELSRQGRPGAPESISLPATTAVDGPDGYRSGFYITDYTQLNSADKTTTTERCLSWPTEVLVADTWNVALGKEMGEAVGEEGLWGGGVGWYGPAANIHRTPYSGRNHEYYSEDGYISGAMAESVIHGAMSKGLVIYVKHCVLNDMELHREGLCTFANEQSIREIYLKAFQAPLETTGEDDPCANGVMGAFNLLGVVWSGHYTNLWREVLRGEWGYTGNITTDFGQEPNGYMEPQLAYEAGTTMFCTSGTAFTTYLEPLIQNDAKLYANMREAAHYTLYNFANSAAMNGLTSSDKVIQVRTWYENALLAMTIVFAVIFAGSVAMTAAQSFFDKKDNGQDGSNKAAGVKEGK